MTGINGLIVIDKPVGPTSHDIVAGIRRKLGVKRVGHAGTLDPGASGVLVACVGTGTRLLEYLAADEKMYTGEIVFGVGTDTDDALGQVVARRPVEKLAQLEIERATQAFTGDILQVVPKYSAVHIDGKRAYQLARSGLDFVPPTKRVHIEYFKMENLRLKNETAKADFTISCSTGTYVRSICRDVGSFLDLPAHMGGLRRFKSGAFTLFDSIPFAKFMAAQNPVSFLRNPLVGLVHMPTLSLEAEQIQRLANGQSIYLHQPISHGTYVVVVDGTVGLIVECVEHQEHQGVCAVRPKKVLLERG